MLNKNSVFKLKEFGFLSNDTTGYQRSLMGFRNNLLS